MNLVFIEIGKINRIRVTVIKMKSKEFAIRKINIIINSVFK